MVAGLALLVLLVACLGGEPPTEPGPGSPFDGYDCPGSSTAGAIAFWADLDKDGFGDPAKRALACSQPPGHSRRGGDCDDVSAGVHPQAPELCNGRDDDCDGAIDEDDAVDAVIWEPDQDGDGHARPGLQRRACAGGEGWVAPGSPPDCDDGDPEVNLGARERCNGIDDDCDGAIDEEEDAADMLTWYKDADGDGWGDPYESMESCGAVEGWLEPAAEADCDDTMAEVHPGARELCNGIDDDCDGVIDEDDAFDAVPWYADTDGDRFGDPGISVIACRPPAGYVSSPGDCDDLRESSYLGAIERCNGLDDDCDGVIDEDDAVDTELFFGDADGDRFGDPGKPRRACSLPRGHSATAGDCDDTRSSVHPEGVEVCNGHDDDCDGAVDEPDADDAITWYADEDGDGFGDPARPLVACTQPSGHVSPMGDCDDDDDDVHPGAGERPDGIDNACDGLIDEGDEGG